MKQTYQQPETNIVTIAPDSLMQTVSGGGVGTGGTVGDDYSDKDATYSRKTFSVWGDDEED